MNTNIYLLMNIMVYMQEIGMKSMNMRTWIKKKKKKKKHNPKM